MLALNLEYSVVESGTNGAQYIIGDGPPEGADLELLLKYFKKTLVLVADTVLKEEQAKGFDMNPIVAVDGVTNRSTLDVKPFGKIEISARVDASDFILKIYTDILEKSPVDTGMYLDYNFIFYNSNPIASNMSELNTWLAKKVPLKTGDIIRFANVMPYASMLERNGITRQKAKMRRTIAKPYKKRKVGPMLVRQPNGTYFLSARAVTRKYKFNSNIRFEWVNGAKMDLAGVPSVSRSGKPLRKTFKKRKGSYVYPSIVVRITEKGLL